MCTTSLIYTLQRETILFYSAIIHDKNVQSEIVLTEDDVQTKWRPSCDYLFKTKQSFTNLATMSLNISNTPHDDVPQTAEEWRSRRM